VQWEGPGRDTSRRAAPRVPAEPRAGDVARLPRSPPMLAGDMLLRSSILLSEVAPKSVLRDRTETAGQPRRGCCPSTGRAPAHRATCCRSRPAPAGSWPWASDPRGDPASANRRRQNHSIAIVSARGGRAAAHPATEDRATPVPPDTWRRRSKNMQRTRGRSSLCFTVLPHSSHPRKGCSPAVTCLWYCGRVPHLVIHSCLGLL
jgi:hypothetical protein